MLTGPKPKGIKVKIFRIDYLIRTPKVKKFSLQPIRLRVVGWRNPNWRTEAAYPVSKRPNA